MNNHHYSLYSCNGIRITQTESLRNFYYSPLHKDKCSPNSLPLQFCSSCLYTFFPCLPDCRGMRVWVSQCKPLLAAVLVWLLMVQSLNAQPMITPGSGAGSGSGTIAPGSGAGSGSGTTAPGEENPSTCKNAQTTSPFMYRGVARY